MAIVSSRRLLASTIEKQALILYQEVKALPVNDNKAGELRMLREIMYIVIAEMVGRVG